MYKMEYDKEWMNKVYIESVKDDGEKEGFEKGKKKGLEKGKKEGFEKGRKEVKRDIAFRLKERGDHIEAISAITGLSLKELTELFKSSE